MFNAAPRRLASYKKSLKLLSQHLQSSEKEELYLIDYYSKLRIAGMDRKGQISTAYAQSGLGLSLGLNFDFGAMLGPGVHLVASANVKGSRTAHALLTLHRAGRSAWLEHIDVTSTKRRRAFTPPEPDWSAERFFALGFLRGTTKEFSVDVGAEAFVGFGAAFDVDETGLTIGAKAGVGASVVTTRLCDPNPGLHADYNTKLLNDDLNGIFRENTKKKAAAWLVEVSYGRRVAIEKGAPVEAKETVLRRLKAAGMTAEKLVIDAGNIWDTHATATANRHGGKVLSSTMALLKRLGKSAERGLLRGRLKTEQLIEDVTAAREQLEKLKRHYEAEADKIARQHDDAPRDHGFIYRMLRRANRKSRRAIKARLKEADGLIARLKRARDLKHFNKVAERKASPGVPQFFLDITRVEGHATAEASAQMILPKALGREKTYVPSLHATVSADGHYRRFGSRFQYYVIGTEGGRVGRRLHTTQDAVVTYTSRKVSADAGSARHRAEAQKEFNLITMCYRAVHANWFDEGDHMHKALPNGSGVSFGMSILQNRIQTYAQMCKPLTDAQIDEDKKFGTEFDRIEEAMRRQLRVPRKDLRRCFRGMPDNLLNEKRRAETFVIEASFAFIKAQELTVKKLRPKNLFDLPAVKKLGNDGSSQDFENTQLQSIRIRYRHQTDEDRTRNYFSLGWNPMVYKEDGGEAASDEIIPFTSKDDVTGDRDTFAHYKGIQEDFDLKKQVNELKDKIPNLGETGVDVPDLQAQSSIGLERVERVGTEGILTVHEHLITPFYPDSSGLSERTIKHLKKKYGARNAELLVPPVKLFSQ